MVSPQIKEDSWASFSVNSDGIVTFGLDLPNSLTGDFVTSGVTFANFNMSQVLLLTFARMVVTVLP